MATLARQKVWGEEVLTLSDLNAEFNNITNFWTAFGITSPLSNALDASNQLILNPRFRKIGQLVNAGEYLTIKAAQAALGGDPGTIWLPPNTTWVTEDSDAITLLDGQYIVGSGLSSVIEQDASWLDSNALQMILIDDGTVNAGVINCAIDGQGVSHDTGTDGVIGIKCRGDKCYFDRLYIHDIGDSGDGISARNDGMLFGDTNPANYTAENFWVTNCFFENCQRNGISIISGRYGHVSDCTMKSCNNSGIDSEPNNTSTFLQEITYSNLNIEDCLVGFVLDGHDAFAVAGSHGDNCRDISVSGLNIYNSGRQGLVVFGIIKSTLSNIVIDLCGQEASDHGIQFQDCSKIALSNFSITGVGTVTHLDSDGIFMGGEAAANELIEDINISNGFIDTVARRGIDMNVGGGADIRRIKVDNVQIGRVGLYDVPAIGISCAADEVTITNNSIQDTAGNMVDGISFAQKSAANIQNIVCVGNFITGFSGSGIANTTGATVTNILFETTTDGDPLNLIV